jgi:hypothetical protein
MAFLALGDTGLCFADSLWLGRLEIEIRAEFLWALSKLSVSLFLKLDLGRRWKPAWVSFLDFLRKVMFSVPSMKDVKMPILSSVSSSPHYVVILSV